MQNKGLLELNRKLDFLMMDVADSEKLSADERVVSAFIFSENEVTVRVNALRREADETILPVLGSYTVIDDYKRQIAEHEKTTKVEHDELNVLDNAMAEISRRDIVLRSDASRDNTQEIGRLSTEYRALYTRYKPLHDIVFTPAIEDIRRKLRQSEEVLRRNHTPPREEIEARNKEIQREIAELNNKYPRIKQLLEEKQQAFNAIVQRRRGLPPGTNDDDGIVIQRQAAYRAITAELAAAIRAIDAADTL
jgi:DNA repair exonuclease SbcCD ATPase subunit